MTYFVWEGPSVSGQLQELPEVILSGTFLFKKLPSKKNVSILLLKFQGNYYTTVTHFGVLWKMGSLPVTPCKVWAEGTKVCAHAWFGLREHRSVVVFSCHWGKLPQTEKPHTTQMRCLSVLWVRRLTDILGWLPGLSRTMFFSGDFRRTHVCAFLQIPWLYSLSEVLLPSFPSQQ